MKYFVSFLWFMVVIGWAFVNLITGDSHWGLVTQAICGSLGTGFLFGRTLARWNRPFWE